LTAGIVYLIVNRLAVLLLAAGVALPATVDLAGNARDPFASPARARVFVFVRTDCPITNRYAPELQRLAAAFSDAQFWLVYPDGSESVEKIRRHMMDYSFPGQVLRDPKHELVKRSHVTTAPEAAVFDGENRLMYHGRINDLWVSPSVSRPVARTHDLEEAIAAVLDGRPVKIAETRAVGCALADVQ
jgi:AhpC/TSA family